MNLNSIAVELVRHLGDASVRAVAIALPSALIALLMRRRAAYCHAVWTTVLAGMLLLPLLRPITPPARVQVRSTTPVLAMLIDTAPPSRQLPRVRTPPPTPAKTHPWQFYAAIVYAAGFFFLTARLLTGLLITRRLMKRASQLDLACDAPAFQSSRVRVPLTAGYLSPQIILPPDWRTWDDATRRAVLEHESAHVRRRDGLVNLIAAINTCVFWFHPLAWWLERRLAVLAEHAADDAAIATCLDPQQYASILLSITASLNGHKRRLLWGGVSMQGGRIAERIHRALDSGPRIPRLNRVTAACIWSTTAILVWFAGALQFQTVARAQPPVPPIPEFARLTPTELAQLEQQRAANPDDEKLTQKLLVYYWFNQREQDRAAIIFWMIDHHPEWRLNAGVMGSLFGLRREDDRVKWQANYEEAQKRWAVQVARHPDDPRVLGNAASALSDGDETIAIDYLQRAQAIEGASAIDPNYCRNGGGQCDWTEVLARHYAWALTGRNAQLAAQVRASLQSTTDSRLITDTVQCLLQNAGQSVLGGRGPQADLGEVRSIATALLDRAEQLQPGSQSPVELREGLRQLGVSLMPANTNAPAPPVIRVGGGVQAANLISSPPPVNPRGIEGTVKLQVRITTEGRVDLATVISGDPALVDAAIAAVQQYVYKPTLLNNQPTAVLTTVDIPFHLRQ